MRMFMVVIASFYMFYKNVQAFKKHSSVWTTSKRFSNFVKLIAILTQFVVIFTWKKKKEKFIKIHMVTGAWFTSIFRLMWQSVYLAAFMKYVVSNMQHGWLVLPKSL